jgi:hypothetical protein
MLIRNVGTTCQTTMRRINPDDVNMNVICGAEFRGEVKIDAVYSCETSVPMYQTTLSHIPEHHNADNISLTLYSGD